MTALTAVASSSYSVLLIALYLLSFTSAEYETREGSNSGTNNGGVSGGSGSLNGERVGTGAHNEFRSCTDGKCIKRTTHEVTGGMWFGPRLGRRRRSDKKSELELVPEFEALANALDGNGRWALITIPSEKRQPTQFTPRLGRESGEESTSMYGFASVPASGIVNSFGNDVSAVSDQDEAEADEQIFPPLFAPRLGRKVPWTPSPRLGRQLRAILASSSNNQYYN